MQRILLNLLIFILIFYIQHAYSKELTNDDLTLFVQKCGSCHKNNKRIRSFTPNRYTSSQWHRFFDKKKHQRKKDISHIISNQELERIKIYLISHSKDSAEPDFVGFTQDKYLWKIGTLVPKNMGWAKLYKEIILPVFEMVTDGNISVKIFWGNIIGDDYSVIKKLESGELDGGGLSGYGTTLLCPEMSVLSLPFMFNNYGEVDYIKKKMGPIFDSLMEKKGYKLILLTDQDFDQIYSRKLPMSCVEDFSKVKIGSWFGTIEKTLLKKLNSKIVYALDNENVYKLIQESYTVDTFIGPALFVLSTNINSNIKYVNQIKIRYAPGTVVLRNNVWNAISYTYKDRLLNNFKKYAEREFSEAIRRDNKRSINALIKYGITDVKMNSKELAKLKKISKEIWFELADKMYPTEVLNELLHHLEVYRSQMRAR